MAISESALQQKVIAWADSHIGRKAVNNKLNAMRTVGNGSGANGSSRLANGQEVPSEHTMLILAKDLISIINRVLPEQISTVSLSSSGPTKNPDGSYSVQIFFDEEDLRRESLENDYQTYTGDGIENIVALFNNGMDAKDFAYGWWDNHGPSGSAFSRSMPGDKFAWVRSKKHRDPLLFMQAAVEEFNTKYSARYGVSVVLSDDYTDNHHWK